MLKPFAQGKNKALFVSLHMNAVRQDVKLAVIVLSAFVGPRPVGNIARHLNDDQACNLLSNLKWGTHAENGRDRVVNDCRGNVKLKDHQVRLIKKSRAAVAEMAARYNVSLGTIYNILNGKTWRHI